MSALSKDCEEIETLVYKRLYGRGGGWRIELLVEQLTSSVEQKFLLCGCCRGLMRDACVLENEGKQQLSCYVCIPQGVAWHQAQINRKAINEKIIRCPLRERGCDWVDTVSRVIQHLEKCEFLPVLCPLRCVESGGERSGKVARVERRLVAEHERDFCPQREQRCEFCGRGVRACKMNPHLGECSWFPVDCPNGCKVAGETGVRQVGRGDLPIHLAECPHRAVKCPYWDYGCREEMQRRQLDLHEREAMHTHFRLTTTDIHHKLELKQTEYTELQSQLLGAKKDIRCLEDASVAKDSMIGSITKDLSALRESVSTLVSTGRLEWKIRGVRQRIAEKEDTVSDPFNVGLYKCQGEIQWDYNNSRKVGCFICIMKGAYDAKLKWPFMYRYKIVLLNQDSGEDDYITPGGINKDNLHLFSQVFERPTTTRNRGFGKPSFISHAELLTGKYTKDNSISLHILIEQLPSF